MSNFKSKAKNKRTGKEVEYTGYDDYFGKHQYGYEIEGKILTEEEFDELYAR